MNEGGMKQRQRFMAHWHKEYVWLSAVWWKQLDLSDGHMVRNLLNDSIPPEKLHEKGFSSLSMSSRPFLRRVLLKMNEKAATETYKEPQTQFKLCILCNIPACLTCIFDSWDTSTRGHLSAFLVCACLWIWLCLTMFKPVFQKTKEDDCLHQQTGLDHFICRQKALKRRYSNCQSETLYFIFCYTIILSKLWFSYNTHWHQWVPQTFSS